MSLAEDLKKQVRKHNDLMKKIDFQVDTIRATDGGYFSPDRNSITLNYKRDNDRFNEWSQSNAVLLHEQKHRDNHSNGLYEYALSPEQAYKTNMHNEISANMASLIYLRDEYIKTGNINVFDEDNRFSFYKGAVQKGLINPLSSDPKDFEKDMAFIVNETRNMWEKDHSENYNKNSMYSASYRSDKSGKYAKYYDENYQRAMKIAYTIGGVDFTKYMDRDVEIPKNGKSSLKIMQIQTEGKSNADVAKELNLPIYDGSMSLAQYQKLCYHQMTMNKYLEGKSGNNRQKFNDVAFIQKGKTEHQDKEQMIEYCQWERDKYKKAYNSLSDAEKSGIDALVDAAAREYMGKSPKANEKAYQTAVDKIYTQNVTVKGDINYNGAINLRETLNCDAEIDKNTKLSPEAAKKQNMGKKEGFFRRYCDFMGVPAPYVDTGVDNLKNSNAFVKWGGAVCVGIGAPFIGGYEWCKKKLSSDKVENKPLNRVNKEKPKYRKWENKDGSRVSEVQYRTLPDMTKDIIQKPKTSSAVKTSPKKQQTKPQTSPAVKTSPMKPQTKPQTRPQKQPVSKPQTRPQTQSASKFTISLRQVSGSYDQAQLKTLCSSAQRWNQGRNCNAEQYTKAAKITGLPAELIAYAYEVNRKNFPKQAMEAQKVMNTSKLSDEEIAKSVANVLSHYDIEKGSFFAVRNTPRQIRVGQSIRADMQRLSGRGQPTALSFRQMQGEEGCAQIDAMMLNRMINNLARG